MNNKPATNNMKPILLTLTLILMSVLPSQAQSWGFTIGNVSFFSGGGTRCYNNNVVYGGGGGWYGPQTVVTYMPQNVYMRPYQYMPQPQPIIINNNVWGGVRGGYYQRECSSRW